MERLPKNHRRDDVYELLELAKPIWRHRLLVVVTTLAFLGAGVAYLLFAPPVYVATTRLLVERLSLEKPVQQRHEPAFVATQAEIFKSRVVAERALEVFTPPHVASAEDPVLAVLEATRVTPVEGTDVMQVAFQSADSDDAVQMLEALVASYSGYLRESESDTQLEALRFLTETERELRDQLEQKQAEYRQHREQNALVGVGQDAGRVRTQYLTDLGKALTLAKSRRLELENQSRAWMQSRSMNRLEGTRPFVSKMVPASFEEAGPAEPAQFSERLLALPKMEEIGQLVEIRNIEKELREARQWEKELDLLYGGSYPDLRTVRSRIETLEARLDEMVAGMPDVLESEIEAVQRDERALQELYEQETERAKQLDIQQLQEQQLVDTIERLQAVHDSILAEMHARQLASASAANGQGTVHVKKIAAPRSTGKPVWPIPAVVLALCGAVGLCVGFGGALGMERLSHLRHSPDTASDSPRAAGASASAPEELGEGAGAGGAEEHHQEGGR